MELGWEPSLQFEEGIEETVKWYLENQEWMDHVTSGEYQKYYEEMYCWCPTCPSPAGGSLILNQAFPLTIKGKDVTALSADFSTSPSLLQGELHILTKPSLLEKGRM